MLALPIACASSWQHVGPAPSDHSVTLTIATRNRNLETLERRANEISDPGHADYGLWLSHATLYELTAPEPAHVSAVDQWLAGCTNCTLDAATPSRDLLQLTVPVSAAAVLLGGTEYHIYRDQNSSAMVLRTLVEPVLPAAVAEALDFISPTTFAASLPPHGHKGQPIATVELQPGGATTGDARRERLSRRLQGEFQDPKTLRKRYAVGNVEGRSPNNSQAVTGFLGQFYSHAYLQQFFRQYYPPAVGRTPALFGDGGDAGNVGVEASIDTEYIMSMGGGVATQFWSFSGNAPGTQAEPWLKFLVALGASDAPPLVISMSYSEPEADIPAPYAARCNVELMKAAARGLSLLVSSGDQGVAGESGCGSDCKAGSMCLVPRWPPGSPWVTVVGGTTTTAGAAESGAESAWMFSSGGFSNRFAMPAYQASAVRAYLRLGRVGGLPSTRQFNASGRAFPDVSALATDFETVGAGYADGTSCSAPTFAGIVALLNELRLQRSQPPLGFLNPWLYKASAALTDVTAGTNPGCYTQGFPAKPGWDGSTGLGTPDYLKLASSMPRGPSGSA